jgi:dipeptidyl aminopeptidase/acylaminoacyl peptidase
MASWFRLATLAFFGLSAVVIADDSNLNDLKKQMAELQKKIADIEKTPTTAVGPKPLSIADTDIWRSIRGAALSNDGKWFAHRVSPAEGNGEVILRSNAVNKETRFPGGGGTGKLQFSFDSKWLAFTVSPYVKANAPPSPLPRPKPKLVLVNTANGEKTELESVSSFGFSGESASHLVYRKAMDAPAPPPGGLPPGLTLPPSIRGQTGAPEEATVHTGTDLVVRELSTGVELVLGNIAEYSFNKTGSLLILVIDAAGQVGNGIQIREMANGAVHPVETAKASFRGLTWNEETTAFSVTKSVVDPGYEGKWVSVIGMTNLGPKPTRTLYDPKSDADFPKEMAIGVGRSYWSDDLDALVFSIVDRKKKEGPAPAVAPSSAGKPPEKVDAPKKDEPKKDGPPAAAPTAPAVPSPESGRPSTQANMEPKPELVIWHWKDERIQPMQQVQATSDKNFSYSAMYKVKEKKFLRLADAAVKSVNLAPKGKFAIGRDVKPYEYMSNLDGRRYSDVYVTNIANGERKKALTKAQYVFGTSPTGTHFLYYQDGHFFTYDLAAMTGKNITESITETNFVDQEDDHNVVKQPRLPLGWSRDGTTAILSDGWDIWAVKADGSGGKNLTVNGKATGTRYQSLTQFETDPKPGIDLTKPLYVGLFGEWTKREGLVRIDPVSGASTSLLTSDCMFSPPIKARNADVFAYTQQTTLMYPDYHLTDATFKPDTKVTEANPQQKEYLWTAGAKLIDYVGTNNKKLQGVLHLPAGYTPGKTYPMVVYIYEKLSQGMHRYSGPSYRGGFNPAIYTSNGYAVFNPDITYRLNDPGKSSMECILPAVDAAVATGLVNAGKIALHGHSWGGYQTAFAVTQTTKFKCAIAGAPLTDLISMYSSVYWNSGSANQPIFESSQGRFTGGYWEQQEAYIRNSPVFFAKNVQTPLLLLHNDKDGAVDFTQGVEYYNTLRRLQKPVVMLQYKGENHGLAKPENQKDYATRMREYFDHYLMDKPAPEWWTAGIPHLKMDEHLKQRKP